VAQQPVQDHRFLLCDHGFLAPHRIRQQTRGGCGCPAQVPTASRRSAIADKHFAHRLAGMVPVCNPAPPIFGLRS